MTDAIDTTVVREPDQARDDGTGQTDPVQTPDFDAVYAADADPWSVADSFYEQRKLALLLGALSRAHYRLAWDPGCGTGHLVSRLAQRCDRVVGSDASSGAVQIARRTVGANDRVAILQARAQDEPPGELAGRPDLVVISEFLYYLTAADRGRVLAHVAATSAPEAEVVAVHWRSHPHDAYLSGADTQTEIVTTLTRRGWHPVVHLDDPDFVLDSLRRQA